MLRATSKTRLAATATALRKRTTTKGTTTRSSRTPPTSYLTATSTANTTTTTTTTTTSATTSATTTVSSTTAAIATPKSVPMKPIITGVGASLGVIFVFTITFVVVRFHRRRSATETLKRDIVSADLDSNNFSMPGIDFLDTKSNGIPNEYGFKPENVSTFMTLNNGYDPDEFDEDRLEYDYIAKDETVIGVEDPATPAASEAGTQMVYENPSSCKRKSELSTHDLTAPTTDTVAPPLSTGLDEDCYYEVAEPTPSSQRKCVSQQPIYEPPLPLLGVESPLLTPSSQRKNNIPHQIGVDSPLQTPLNHRKLVEQQQPIYEPPLSPTNVVLYETGNDEQYVNVHEYMSPKPDDYEINPTDVMNEDKPSTPDDYVINPMDELYENMSAAEDANVDYETMSRNCRADDDVYEEKYEFGPEHDGAENHYENNDAGEPSSGYYEDLNSRNENPYQ